jgi:glycosyltransferase involved in cell wall biosynthesis
MPKNKVKALILIEAGASCRYWETSIPILMNSAFTFVFGSVGPRGPLHDFVESLGICVFSLDCRSSRDYARGVSELRKIMKDQCFAIVHASESLPAVLTGIAGLMGGNGRRIFHRHHTFPEGRQVLLSRVGSRLAHHVMGCSRSAALAAHERDGVPLSRISVAPNGMAPLRKVSLAEMTRLKKKLKIPADALVLSIVGRLREVKGHRTLWKALPLVAARLKQPLHVAVVGDGPIENELRREGNRISEAKVHFVGHQEDVALWYGLADVVAMPSYSESFGLTALEAMSCGRPVVASRVGGLSEVIEDRISGLLVEPRQPSSLAESLLAVLNSPPFARQLGRGGVERARHFTIQRMVEHWQIAYRRAIGSPGLFEARDWLRSRTIKGTDSAPGSF